MSLTDAPVEKREQQSKESAGRDALKNRGIYRVALAYGSFIHRFRWLLLALWIVVVAVSVSFMI